MASDIHAEHSKRGPRTCIVSPRGLTRQLSRCCSYEFEDIVQEMEGADLLTTTHSRVSPYMEKVRNRAANASGLYRLFPTGTSTRLSRTYDVCFFVIQFARDIVNFDMVRDWRKKSGIAVCVIEELWLSDIDRYWHKLKMLRNFDLIICGCAGSVDALAGAINRPVHYLPPAVDAIKFTPDGKSLHRFIDVCAIGRQSAATHRALVHLARSEGLYYHHDTLVGPYKAREPSEHRLLLASIIKHSRYFLASTAKIDQSHETNEQQEVGFRFFEGMAGGAVILGTPPKTGVFEQLFDWPDAIVETPFDHPDIGDTLRTLDRDPERIEKIRVNNTAGILRKHDWLHRWRAILEHLDLPEPQGLLSRERELKRLQKRVETSGYRDQSSGACQTMRAAE